MRGFRRLGVACTLAGALAPAIAHGAAAPSLLDADEPLHTENGSAQLEFVGGDPPFQLEFGPVDAPTEIVYEGRLPSAHLSGLPDGAYIARVRGRVGDGWSAWSKPRRITVEHVSMQVAMPLLALGALTVFATAFVVVRAGRESH